MRRVRCGAVLLPSRLLPSSSAASVWRRFLHRDGFFFFFTQLFFRRPLNYFCFSGSNRFWCLQAYLVLGPSIPRASTNYA